MANDRQDMEGTRASRNGNPDAHPSQLPQPGGWQPPYVAAPPPVGWSPGQWQTGPWAPPGPWSPPGQWSPPAPWQQP